MPQIGLYVASVSVGVGATAVVLAWDRNDRGPDAADDLDISDVGLFTWFAPTTGAQLVKAKTKSPIEIPAANCPQFPTGEGLDGDLITRLEAKPGASGLGAIADLSFEIYDGATMVYSAAPGATIKFELSDNSIIPSTVSIQDRPTVQAWEETLDGLSGFVIGGSSLTKDIWRALMTPNQPLEWF